MQTSQSDKILLKADEKILENHLLTNLKIIFLIMLRDSIKFKGRMLLISKIDRII